MAIQRRFCTNHSDRPAIGICVLTQKPICSECSTRYEGVNYSKEGLEILHLRRAQAVGRSSAAQATLIWLASPVLLCLLFLAYWTMSAFLTNLLHRTH